MGSLKSTPVGTPKLQTPKIHEPPNAPVNQKESAPQRFKKGNLRLLQSEDGGWKLEELEEKRKSLEAGFAKNDSIEIPESSPSRKTLTVSQGESKPPQAEFRKDRKKKSSREEKSENQLLRRPSMKKIKAFFDKDKNKENKEEKENDKSEKISDSDYASAVSKLPSLESSVGIPSDQISEPTLPLGGSKSVPSSLDRKQRYRDPDYAQIGSFDNRSLEKTTNNNLSKYWPLGKSSKQSNTTPKPPPSWNHSIKADSIKLASFDAEFDDYEARELYEWSQFL